MILTEQQVEEIDKKLRGIPQAHEMARVLDSHEELRAELRDRAAVVNRPVENSTAIGVGAYAKESNMLALAAGGQNVLELFGDSGEIKVFGKLVLIDRDLAVGVHQALREFMTGLAS